MNQTNEKIVSWLFETKAVRVCPKDKPFWYTSGTIGPYYINTHFLYGSEQKANELLKFIDIEKNDIYTCPQRVLDIARANYENDSIYRGLIDEIVLYIKANIDIGDIDCISGGERRDWFFSLIVAEILSKPHITIYKDLMAVVSEGSGKAEEINDLACKKVLHIADLITEASSYERAWIPSIKQRGGQLKWSLVVVDRKQGGAELLGGFGVKSFSLIDIDKNLFDVCLSMGLINKDQHAMIVDYVDNPKDSMRSFLKQHPEFIKNALDADEKTKERVRLCQEKNIYGL